MADECDLAQRGKRVFIGSTAKQVLEYISCDVLVVKTPNFAELGPM